MTESKPEHMVSDALKHVITPGEWDEYVAGFGEEWTQKHCIKMEPVNITASISFKQPIPVIKNG